MQRRQQSLLSFFANNSTSNVIGPQVSERDSDDDIREKKPLHDHTIERPHNIRKNFDMLKNKFLRPQKITSSENHHRLLQTAGTDTSFNPSISRNRSEQSLQETPYSAPNEGEKFAASRVTLENFDAAQEVEDGEHYIDRTPSRRIPNSLGCRPSIPGIKRIQEDHGNPLQDESCASPLLKRRKLLEALGDGELHHGLWEEAKSKFEWMNPSNIRDGKGRKPGHPHYDKRTVQIPNDVLSKMSASQKQYWATKCQYMDTVIFFKVGKFYELYELDAEIGHKELNWKLTLSGVGKCRQVGVSESGIEDAVQKLLTRGYKVGRMEQTETAAEAKSKRGPNAMIQRKLTHVLTPATAMDENMRPEAVHLLAIREEPENSSNSCLVDGGVKKVIFGFAFVDAAACRFYVGSLHDDNSRSALGALLTQVAPQELLYELGGLSEETMNALRRYSYQGFLPLELTPLQPNLEFIEASAAINVIESNGYFGHSIGYKDQCSSGQMNRWLGALKAVNDFNSSAIALGALVLHLRRIKLDEELLKEGLIAPYEVYGGSLRLDGQTLSNLEVFKNNADGSKSGTLLCFLDNCSTSFGKRRLHRWMCHPLQKIDEINDRLDAVDELRSHPDLLGMLRTVLRQLPDLERLLACLHRLVGGSSHATTIPLVWNRIQTQKAKAFCSVVKGLLCAFDLLRSVHKGDREGPLCTRLLQKLSELEEMTEAYELLVTINLDIETHFSSPKGQFLRQGMDDKDCDLLNRLLMLFNKQNGCWSLIIENLSQVDVLVSFCVSTDGANGPTCRPEFVSKFATVKGDAVLKIKGLWHPFATGGHCGVFVRNDVELGCDTNPCRAMLLTGPNMGGKSTLLRATCLAVILAQLGCYVPAESCIMSPVDTIFTRLGASDRIMSGESTFMVECMEASSVLRYATGNSLVILDELGRGTSTFDGYAIAYAVFRHLVDTINCRLLFATHYHPLTKEFAAHPSVIIQHMSSAFQSRTVPKCVEIKQTSSSQGKEMGEIPECYAGNSSICEKSLVFLYKLSSGPSPDSYGLHVALLAGMPITVVKRAEQARSIIQSRLSSTFESTSFREQFSHAHDEWLRTILSIPNLKASNCSSLEMEDAYDTLVCIRHEVQSCMSNRRTKL